MKKNNTDFSIPIRQSYAAIILIIYKYYKIVLQQLIPLILIIFIGGQSTSNWKIYLIYLVIAIALLSMIVAVIAYFRFYFYIADHELVVEKGILQRKKTSIPFDRIQTINLEQNIFHRVLGVVRLQVDTAGTAKNEFEFDALQKDIAEDLRNQVMDWKKNQKKSETLEKSPEAEEFKRILKISTTRLFKIGITENHIKSGFLIIAFFFWIWENVNQAGIDVNEYGEEFWVGFASSILLILLILFVMISITISLIKTVLLYFDLGFYRSEDGFRIESGLLTKRNLTAKDQKIQSVSFNDNLLKKLLGFKDVTLRQASSVEVGKKLSIKIPGCDEIHVDSVLESLYQPENLVDIEMHPVHYKYFLRTFIYTTLFIAVAVTIAMMLEQKQLGIFFIALWLYLIATAFIRYKKAAYGMNGEMVRIKSGVFGDRSVYFPLYKIQTIRMRQNFYQRRHKLASIDIYTASGGETIPYIPNAKAYELMNYMNYKATSDKRKWM